MTSPATATQARKPLKGARVGQVVSDKCSTTRKVVTTFKQRDAKYGKYVKRRSVFHVHDPENLSHAGDTVEIVPCRPISKTKCWRLVRIVTKAPAGGEGQ
ncbi:MAG: 30S ribosomal protein S17 [Planctomycetes bacterium]|nr:30S ribosomal protein S17 [Planctomycetota bacterium]